MQKNITGTVSTDSSLPQGEWLDLETAMVELSSEDPAHPIESALQHSSGSGWRAAGPGKQSIRLLFETPQPIRRIQLQFEERAQARTQEFVLRWAPRHDAPPHELVRQQWNFSPSGAAAEVEEYTPDLPAVAWLELEIIPDISGGSAVATLKALRLA